jgi:hypothetical protein
MLTKTRIALSGLIMGVAPFAVNASLVTYDGIDFPQGNASFADEVISYDSSYSGGNEPYDANYTDPDSALGAPDYNSPTGSVSLGSGGLLQLLFTDNALTNSGDSNDDLHIFEIGPDVEDTFVAIRPTPNTSNLLSPTYSPDSNGFFSIGSVTGSTSSIDIDSRFSGFDPGLLMFDAVQLIDDPDKDAQGPHQTVGADIDAVGAIFSAAPVNKVPEPGSLALLAGSLLAGGAFRSLKRRKDIA